MRRRRAAVGAARDRGALTLGVRDDLRAGSEDAAQRGHLDASQQARGTLGLRELDERGERAFVPGTCTAHAHSTRMAHA